MGVMGGDGGDNGKDELMPIFCIIYTFIVIRT